MTPEQRQRMADLRAEWPELIALAQADERERIKKLILDLAGEWEGYYPLSIFPEPVLLEDGCTLAPSQTLDRCSAGMGRHMAQILRRWVEEGRLEPDLPEES